MKIGILGAAGYTGGELIRLLINHPEAEIVFANSESNAGNLVSDVVVFFCFGHGKSEQFLKEHTIPANVKIIDLAQDFRITPSIPPRGEASQSSVLPLGGVREGSFIYGLPETHREQIRTAQNVANPGCFATCIQLAMLPALKAGIISGDIHVNGITGSTGAGQKPGATTHFSWRNETKRCRNCVLAMMDAYSSFPSAVVLQGASSSPLMPSATRPSKRYSRFMPTIIKMPPSPIS